MGKTIYCPVCGQRLFDIEQPFQGQIEIKCHRCRQIQRINLYELERARSGESRYMAT